jgi:AcrR family transcriptional regulator
MMPKRAELAPKKLDGRRMRRQKNRRLIVKAMLELVRGGVISPSAEEVAARAGVGLRTVFRHFDDMDSLYREMAEAMRQEVLPIVEMPFRSSNWRERVAELVERRARIFETLMPFKNAADVHRHRSPFLRRDYAELRAIERTNLKAALPESIRNDRTRFEALDLILSFDIWQRLRQEQKLSVAQARKTVELAARALTSASSEG